jgi:hypothetical protein
MFLLDFFWRRAITVPDPVFALQKAISETVVVPISTTSYQASTVTPVELSGASIPFTPSLTTIFTPAASCLANVYNISSRALPSILTLAPLELTACYPNSQYAVFSPGICPAGYTVALAGPRPLIYLPSSTAIETDYACCPRYVVPASMLVA